MFNPDSSYHKLMDLLYSVPSEGLSDALQQTIPLLAICGGQSNGKSKCLEALTQLAFLHGTGMCTRFAIKVNLRRDVTLTEDLLTAKIEGEDGFNQRYKIPVPRDTFRTMIEEASTTLCGASRPISDKVLEITLTGPTQSPLTVVDLPGIIGQQRDSHGDRLPETIKNITRRYIQDPRTIILAVIGANNDFEASSILTLAKEYDPAGERTIPIVTRTDEMRDPQGWLSVIQNKDKFMRHGWLVVCNKTYEEDPSWEYARMREAEFFRTGIWRKVHPSRKGRVAVKEFLSKLLHDQICTALPAIKNAVSSELRRLQDELDGMGTPIVTIDSAREHISLVSMDLQRQVIRFLNADYSPQYLMAYADKSLAAMSRRSGAGNETDDDDEDDEDGEESANDDDDDDEDNDTDDEAEVDDDSTVGAGHTAGEDPRFVRSALQRLHQQYRCAMMDGLKRVTYAEMEKQVALYKGYELPGFVSFTTFKSVYNGHYLPAWMTITQQHVDKMHQFFRNALQAYFRHACPSPSTAKVFTRSFSRFAREQKHEIDKTVVDIFGDEETPFALNRKFVEATYMDRSKNNQLPPLPTELSVTERNESPLPQQTHQHQRQPQPSQTSTPPPEPSQPVRVNAAIENKQNPSRDTGDWNDVLTTNAMVPCMLAYLATALDRIVDVVLMQTVERHMVRRIHLFFDAMVKPTDDMLTGMLEPAALQERRNDVRSKIAELERLMDEL
ncbi:hypothetical protein BGW42_001130 [Actinomortierella wolfii]|nr:hypothetical protein BGW42_001130 [Actinomortierella wolfii]